MKVDQNAYRQATVFLNTENCLIFASAEGEDSEREGERE